MPSAPMNPARTQIPIHAQTADADETGGLQSALISMVDLGLLATLFAVPFVMGGRQAWGQLVLTVAACWTAIFWAAYQSTRRQATWTSTRAEPILLAAAGLTVLQIVHLPVHLIGSISPRISQMLPLWNSGAESVGMFEDWTQLSLTVPATKLGLMTFLSYALIFWITAQRIRRVEDVERLLRWVCFAAVSMAAFGLVQYLAGNGRFFWFYEHPFTEAGFRVKGSFTNKNHFAQFLALSIGPLIWWILRILDGKQGRQRDSFGNTHRGRGHRELAVGLVLASLGIVVFAGLLSMSRGGVVAMFVAACVSIGVLYRAKLVSGKLLASLVGMGLLVASSLLIMGFEQVSRRLNNWESDGRWQIWKANVEIAKDFPVFGTGVGSHAEIYPMYFDQPFVKGEFTHAENSYLQVASETGLVGLSLALLAIVVLCVWCFRGIQICGSQRITIALAAIAGSLFANLVHAIFDFIWYVPGCMVVVTILAACACRLYQIAREGQMGSSQMKRSVVRPAPRFAWAMSLVAVIAMGTWMVHSQIPSVAAEPHWHNYLKLSIALDNQKAEEQESYKFDEAAPQEPTDPYATMREQLKSLKDAVEANPNNARVQLRMAMGYSSLFNVLQRNSENPMSVAQIRDAVWASNFESPEAQREWLQRAVGKNLKYLDSAWKHARRSLKLSPMQGPAYLYLSELGFLYGGDREGQQQYIQQALLVRPHAAQVLFVAGREAWLAGEYERALKFWKESFQRDLVYQQRIVDLLIDYVPATFFIQNFEPDWDALVWLEKRYRRLNRPADHQVVLKVVAETAVERADQTAGHQSIKNRLLAASAYTRLGLNESVATCLESAVKTDSNSYNARHTYGMWLYQQNRHAEAAKHLTWCLRLKPDDDRLRRIAERAHVQGLRGTTDPMGGTKTAKGQSPGSLR